LMPTWGISTFCGRRLAKPWPPRRTTIEGFGAAEDSLTTVGGVGVLEVDDAVFGFARAHVGQQIAERRGSERLKALGHQRTSGAAAGFDVAGFDFEFARVVAQRDDGTVFAHNDAVERLIVFGLDADGDVVLFDEVIGIEDVHEQLMHTVRAHAGQFRADIAAFHIVLVAHAAVLDVDRFASGSVAGPGNIGFKFRDDGGLLFSFRATKFFHDGARSLRDFLVGVISEAINVCGTESSGSDFAGLQTVDDRCGPIAALDHLREGCVLQFGRERWIGVHQHSADSRFIDAAERLDEFALERGGAALAEQVSYRRNDFRIDVARADQAGGELELFVFGA